MLQTTLNLTTAFGMIIPALTSIIGLFAGINAAYKVHNILSALSAKNATEESIAESASAITKLSKAAATKFLAKCQDDLNDELRE
jgi:hypothetical protein